ncbi:UDP-N-acetylglucosamine diphosphorylase/glucosamine-1-phosphate N-acetyltransferase [Comamonas serinivorans]|uniref:Bifunctional protein GlmU n=1 Tax=Comamonas serinivorans TaxID=1082851 RepID=A0A1Y0ES21_9BURK|nr:bifunctional UDP-N-acetylglucosamine diphosphorylase/glucosamine-1-phosphate N-acetyltransferase GlmU [Comamonas serinivorans]ARU06220.1 UDP-N-acetylglucosamine diphosphorylase/glucosamine-1-phosphate N-acetyltransferase [Comamonas serinivorans]
MNSAIEVAIMAAGKGTRMKSSLPKVLQRLAGKPLLDHVLDTVQQLAPRRVAVIVGHQAEAVQQHCAGWLQAQRSQGREPGAFFFPSQMPQLGTGHAVQQAQPHLSPDATVLILSGDVPLTEVDTLRQLVALAGSDALALLTVRLPDPSGYGRIVRAPGGADAAVQAIVEHKDASEAQRAIDEIYSGIMAVPMRHLSGWLGALRNNNAQGEYYLTDVVKMAVEQDIPVKALCIADATQVEGVNSPRQLAQLERACQLRQAHALLDAGVRLADPARFDLRGELDCGEDVDIDVGCVFEGRVQLGSGVRVGAHCVIANAHIASGVQIQPFTHIDGGSQGITVGAGSQIGPFARLRPGAVLGADVHIGNFVEVKNSSLADGAKANHLAYLGDATVGERVNYGAGSITANYDGANKHRTVIEADVHVGSNCVLVAPVTLGAGGTIGGGSTVNKSTPPGALTIARAKPVSFANWKRPSKADKPRT